MTLHVHEFMRRFLQHVLPTGFMKVRYYGFLNPFLKMSIDELKARIELASGFEILAPAIEEKVHVPPVCRVCDGPLRYRTNSPPVEAAMTG